MRTFLVKLNLALAGIALCACLTATAEAQEIKATSAPGMAHVTGIGELRNLASGTTARLYLPDSYNARVCYVKDDDTEAYVRDHTGAICFYNVPANPKMRYNQHIAGWITGKYLMSDEGVPEFIVAEGDLTNTCMLVIADRVTEAMTHPVEISSQQYHDYIADWVTIKSLRTSTDGGDIKVGDFVLSNHFVIGEQQYYQTPYTGALVDLTGIARPEDDRATIAPIMENGNRPLTYVIDQDSAFVSPPADIAEARVRLVRKFSPGLWNPLTVPFEVSGDLLGAQIKALDSLSPAQVAAGSQSMTGALLNFTEVSHTTAGTPCLVRPQQEITEITLGSVTLSATAAQTVTLTLDNENYSLKGTYSPLAIEKNERNWIFDRDGNLAMAREQSDNSLSIGGTSACVVAPAGRGVTLTDNGPTGDVNEDGIINVSDVTALINTTLGVANWTYVDINKDGLLNVTDVTALINKITGI